MTLSRPKLFRQQDDNEGIRLRRRELVGTNPRIPAACAQAFGSFIVGFEVGKARLSNGRRRLGMTAMKSPMRSCVGGSDLGPLSSPSGPKVSFEVGKAWLSGVRRRPPAARHEGRGNADTIPLGRLGSGPVIISNETKRCLGEAQFWLLPSRSVAKWHTQKLEDAGASEQLGFCFLEPHYFDLL
ncbi:hypothetical protein THAOC_14107 [Thalassiosira oceanica]|uniref:Uncharacterized protein n=1 Tax=Thalassiosira oceanica TaxID=159749 RepID=K0SVT7_THAOC|nr:hypothetical protein THAOC_14107 [Thalassiosira oceanica]|eukprot:EJK65086.1 hypothetical protein THAOC_14107 [Thalassiosira oceanica]